jgi:uncharacterized coiled-coil protein SlyX
VSEDSFTAEHEEGMTNTEQPKKETNKEVPKRVRKEAHSSQASKPVSRQRSVREQGSITVQSSKEQAKQLDRMSKSIEKQSKSIEKLGEQIAGLQNRLVHTERSISDAMTFMKNRGWKKRGKK